MTKDAIESLHMLVFLVVMAILFVIIAVPMMSEEVNDGQRVAESTKETRFHSAHAGVGNGESDRKVREKENQK